jgi:hypothetical protein
VGICVRTNADLGEALYSSSSETSTSDSSVIRPLIERTLERYSLRFECCPAEVCRFVAMLFCGRRTAHSTLLPRLPFSPRTELKEVVKLRYCVVTDPPNVEVRVQESQPSVGASECSVLFMNLWGDVGLFHCEFYFGLNE